MKMTTSKAAATKMTKTLKFFKMQQFMLIMTIIVIVNTAKVTAKTAEEEALEKHILEIRQKCIETSKLSKEQTEAISQQKLFTKDSTVANTPKEVKCYCACYLEEFGLFTDGKPNEKVLRQLLPQLLHDKKKADAALDKCMKLEGKDKCDIGFSFQQCVIKETGLFVY